MLSFRELSVCAGLSAAVALAMTPFVCLLALRAGLFDRPTGDPLKIHTQPMPLLGGLAVLIAAAAGAAVCLPRLLCAPAGAVAAAVLLVFGIGLWDDTRPLRPLPRLAVQCAAAVLAAGGALMPRLGGNAVLAAIVCVAVVGLINAYNVTDGMDGLCAGMAFLGSAGFCTLGMFRGDAVLAAVAGVMAGSIAGFLPYNMPRARIFLGDNGSGLLGFTLGLMAAAALPCPLTAAGIAGVLMLVAIPAGDMAVAIIRRAIRRQPLSQGDRDHIYDLLLKRGFTQQQVWLTLCIAQAIFVGIGLVILL